SPRYASRAASGTPETPMMPHICRSVSHAPGKRREIYLPETSHGALEIVVGQFDPNDAVGRSHHAGADGRDAELLGEGRNSGRAPSGAGPGPRRSREIR